MARLNLTVGDDVPALLLELSGSDKKMGAYVTNLVRAAVATEQEAQPGGDLETLRLAFAGLAGKQKEVEGRLLQVERQLAAILTQSKAQ